MEVRRAAHSGRVPSGSGHPVANLPAGPRALQERRRQVPRSHRERDVELHHSDESVAGRGGEGDQRQGADRYQRREDESFAESRTAIAGVRRAARRRYDLVGQLAVLRLVDGSWPDDATPWHRRSFRSGYLSELGLVVAGESARAVQPRLLRSHRQALRSHAAAGVVECGHGQVGGQRRSRLQARFQAGRAHGAVHHESGGRGTPFCSAGRNGRWSDSRVLRAD